MIIDDKILDELLEEAKKSPRLRMNRDMRTSPEDGSQRMLNALLPGTVLPIHRHRQTTEFMTLLRGRLEQIYYDDEGHDTEHIILDPRDGVYAISIPKGQWHSTIALEPSVIFEAKDGAFVPIGPEDIIERKQNVDDVIESLRLACRRNDIPTIIRITSCVNVSDYKNHREFMELYRQALTFISD
jgi:cupin fold WbuC family metalloprotein